MSNKIIIVYGNRDKFGNDSEELIRKLLDDLDDDRLAKFYEGLFWENPFVVPEIIPWPYPEIVPWPYPEIEPWPYPEIVPWPYPEIEPWPYPEIVPWPYPEIEPWPYPEIPWPDPNRRKSFFEEPYQLPSDYEFPKTDEDVKELSRRIREAIERSASSEKQDEHGERKVYIK